jgi:hypothetical protein
MQYTKPQNVWNMTREQMSSMQPGQWVYAGQPADAGMFLGIKPSGTVVVAWLNNIRNHGRNRRAYIRSLRQYAKGS